MKLILLIVACCSVLLPESQAWEWWSWSDFPVGEWCHDSWIPVNYTKFKESFQKNVFGQPLVEEVVKNVFMHLKSDNPKKALVLAFQGWPGVGKNLVAKLLAESIYTCGTKSRFYKFYNARVNFPLENKTEEYKKQLQQEVGSILSKCARSFFVFDEVDRMQPKLLDAIKPYIDYQDQVNGVDPRPAVFIFLSNKGGSKIAEIAYNLWKENTPREKFKLSDFKESLITAALTEFGGLQHSANIHSYLVNFYVPFLPLQKEHVIQCIEAELRHRGKADPSGAITREVFQEIKFTKPDSFTAGLFAVAGCKIIDSEVASAVYQRDEL